MRQALHTTALTVLAAVSAACAAPAGATTAVFDFGGLTQGIRGEELSRTRAAELYAAVQRHVAGCPALTNFTASASSRKGPAAFPRLKTCRFSSSLSKIPTMQGFDNHEIRPNDHQSSAKPGTADEDARAWTDGMAEKRLAVRPARFRHFTSTAG